MTAISSTPALLTHLPMPAPTPAGRLEFAGYLPPNCQAALIQPVGKDGVLVVGSDTQRGFSRLDQVRVQGRLFAVVGCLSSNPTLRAVAGDACTTGCTEMHRLFEIAARQLPFRAHDHVRLLH